MQARACKVEVQIHGSTGGAPTEGVDASVGDLDDAARQRDFRDALRHRSGLTVAEVRSPEELGRAVFRSLHGPSAQRTEGSGSRWPTATVKDSQGVVFGDGTVLHGVFVHGRPRRNWLRWLTRADRAGGILISRAGLTVRVP